jgi:hypothetical protein
MTSYRPCRTCGRYTAAGQWTARGHCSPECGLAYSACINCGTYFLKGQGFDGEHCSRDCTVKYVILRKYGPEPVTIVAEV